MWRKHYATLLLLLFICGGKAFAQSSLCDCPEGATDTVISRTICIDSVNYDVDITVCHINYLPPSTIAPCNDGYGVNSFTGVKKVCATGIPLPPNNQKILKAVFCVLDPLSGDALGLRSSIPYCDEEPNYYCWVIAMPRCVQRLGPCLVRCPNSECCIRQWRFCKNRPDGDMNILMRADCTSPNANCQGSCLEELCQYYVPGTCPTCH